MERVEQGCERGGESAASDAGGKVAKQAIVAAAKAAPKGAAGKAEPAGSAGTVGGKRKRTAANAEEPEGGETGGKKPKKILTLAAKALAKATTAARKVQATCTTALGNLLACKSMITNDPQWLHLKSDANLEDMQKAIDDLETLKAKQSPHGGTWEQWLHRDVADLRKEHGDACSKVFTQMPIVFTQKINKAESVVKTMRAMHAKRQQQEHA